MWDENMSKIMLRMTQNSENVHNFEVYAPVPPKD